MAQMLSKQNGMGKWDLPVSYYRQPVKLWQLGGTTNSKAMHCKY